MTQVPILADGDLSSSTAQWDVSANAINKSVLGGDTIIELATTPAGTQTNEIRWSNVHQALVRWTGTQWVFIDGAPAYFEKYDFGQTQVAGDLFGPFTAAVGGLTSIAATAAPHFSVATMSTSASANAATNIRTPSITATPGGQPGLRFRSVMSFKLAVATTVSRVGFHDGTTSTAPVDGAWLDVVAGVASFKTSQASTVTTHATTLALVADRWYTIHIWFTTATACRCIVVRDDGTIDLDVTNTTNVPSSAQFFAANALCYNTAAGAVVAHTFDWMGYGYAL